jgi:hypothetical protein
MISLVHFEKAAKPMGTPRRLVGIDGRDACDTTIPLGGFRQAGFGRDRSCPALYKYADLKSVPITIR